MKPMMRNLNIYGDNVLECHDTAILLANALEAELIINPDSPLFAPSFTVQIEQVPQFSLQLIPGYGRWDKTYDAINILKQRGARLREAPDSIVTEIVRQGAYEEEAPLLAFEFSGALPAGNNAWQRCGRALSCAESHVPYLYYAELGGVELDSDRQIKASRFPNPIVPFAYLSLGQVYEVLAMPVYIPSPSTPAPHRDQLDKFFGNEDALEFIKGILLKRDVHAPAKRLAEKALGATVYLAKNRKRETNIIAPAEWQILAELQDGERKAAWLLERKLPWRKKISISTTYTLQTLKQFFERRAFAVCSSEMPFCILSARDRGDLKTLIANLYSNRISSAFLEWVGRSETPLAICWIAGFKPRGDDSRPDRGLPPLLRMVLGEEHVEMLSIVYGPAKETMWESLERDMWNLADTNGLWQAILNLSNGVLVDSQTSMKMSSQGLVIAARRLATNSQIRQRLSIVQGTDPIRPIAFGEHDVDALLHFAFSSQETYIAEGLCNPPGGNWSGISIYDPQEELEFRWTSLPRVSGAHSKRPDHLFQFKQRIASRLPKVILIVESKDRGRTVENEIGPRLTNYFFELLKLDPNITRTGRAGTWGPFTSELKRHLSDIEVVTAAAFRFESLMDLQHTFDRAQTDLAIGVEFSNTNRSTLHILLSSETRDLAPIFELVSQVFEGRLEVKIY